MSEKKQENSQYYPYSDPKNVLFMLGGTSDLVEVYNARKEENKRLEDAHLTYMMNKLKGDSVAGSDFFTLELLDHPVISKAESALKILEIFQDTWPFPSAEVVSNVDRALTIMKLANAKSSEEQLAIASSWITSLALQKAAPAATGTWIQTLAGSLKSGLMLWLPTMIMEKNYQYSFNYGPKLEKRISAELPSIMKSHGFTHHTFESEEDRNGVIRHLAQTAFAGRSSTVYDITGETVSGKQLAEPLYFYKELLEVADEGDYLSILNYFREYRNFLDTGKYPKSGKLPSTFESYLTGQKNGLHLLDILNKAKDIAGVKQPYTIRPMIPDDKKNEKKSRLNPFNWYSIQLDKAFQKRVDQIMLDAEKMIKEMEEDYDYLVVPFIETDPEEFRAEFRKQVELLLSERSNITQSLEPDIIDYKDEANQPLTPLSSNSFNDINGIMGQYIAGQAGMSNRVC